MQVAIKQVRNTLDPTQISTIIGIMREKNLGSSRTLVEIAIQKS
jgi:hypothetical protein